MLTKGAHEDGDGSTFVRRTVLTAVAGGLSFSLTNVFTAQSLAAQLELSIIVGGITLLWQLLVDVEHRLVDVGASFGRLSDELKGTVSDAVKDLGDVTALLVQAENCAIPAADVRDLIAAVVGVPATAVPLAKAVLGEEVARLRTLGTGLKEGVVKRDGEDRDRLLILTRRSEKTIDAVSLQLVDGREFWASGLGNEYLSQQREAVGRGVEIRRVFVFYRQQAGGTVEVPTEMFSRHHERGIKVRFLLPHEIPDLIGGDLRDVIVFDDELSYETTPLTHIGDHGGEIRSNTIEITQADVVKSRAHFEQLWEAAKPYGEADAVAGDGYAPGSAPLRTTPPAPSMSAASAGSTEPTLTSVPAPAAQPERPVGPAALGP